MKKIAIIKDNIEKQTGNTRTTDHKIIGSEIFFTYEGMRFACRLLGNKLQVSKQRIVKLKITVQEL